MKLNANIGNKGILWPIFINVYIFLSLNSIIINMSNIRNKTLILDTQLTFTCFSEGVLINCNKGLIFQSQKFKQYEGMT